MLNWSEVWATCIPLFVLLVVKRKQSSYLKPVIVYLWLALFINLVADFIADFKAFLPTWLHSNNPLYNIHSVVRFACLSYFFLLQKTSIQLKKVIIVVFILFLISNFSIFESFFNPGYLSGSLLTVEAYLLLICCMQYYLFQLRHDVENILDVADFWIVTALSIYVVINFFLFLFYVPMISQNPQLAARMWDVHNVAYIIFCILIAKAFYVSDSH
jgi:hypothetical protein